MPVTPDPPVVNASPTATAISDLSLTVGDTVTGLDLSMYFTDADPLTYTADVGRSRGRYGFPS